MDGREKMKVEKCFIYCRQSSGQDEAENSTSIQQQLINCREYARKKGLLVAGEFIDANVSGKTYPSGQEFETIAENDPGFQQWYEKQTGVKKYRNGLGELMSRIREVDYILLDEITRLHRAVTRSFLESALNFRIVDAHVTILQVKGGSIDLSMFDQQLVQMLRTQINDEQIRNQKEKSRESRRKQKDEGIYSGIRLFASLYGKEKQFLFEEGKGKIVKYVYEQILSGMPYGRICSEINQRFRGELSPGGLFYPSTLRHIAMNPAYAGYMYNSKGELIEAKNIPVPLISQSEWRRTQEAMTRNRESKAATETGNEGRGQHPLSGLLFCGYCGSRLTSVTDRGRIFYYCRRSILAKDRTCAGVRIFAGNTRTGTASYPGLKRALTPLLLLPILEDALETNREKNFRLASVLKRKMDEGFARFCEGTLCEKEYYEIVRKTSREILMLKDLKHEDLSGGDKSGLRKEILACMERTSGDWDSSAFQENLTRAVSKVTVFRDRIHVETHAGEYDLPRVNYSKKRRYMPDWTLTLHAGGGSGMEFHVTYDCRKKKTERYRISEEVFLGRLCLQRKEPVREA